MLQHSLPRELVGYRSNNQLCVYTSKILSHNHIYSTKVVELLTNAGADVSLLNDSKHTPLSVLYHHLKDTSHHSDTKCTKETEAAANILRNSLAKLERERQVEGDRCLAKDTNTMQYATPVPMVGEKLSNKNMTVKRCKKLTIRFKKR